MHCLCTHAYEKSLQCLAPCSSAPHLRLVTTMHTETLMLSSLLACAPPQVDPVTAEMLKAMNLTSTLSVVTVQAVGWV